MKIKDIFESLISELPGKVKIGNVYIGEGCPTYVIAEVGLNHNGDVELAKKLIDAAADAGANAVKFQKRTTSEILTKEGLEKEYTSPHAYGKTYGEHRNRLEFSEVNYRELKEYAAKKKIHFFASVWDHVSADFLEQLGIDAYKIPSADTINIPLLEYVAKKGKPILISTGMNSLEEIQDAVSAVLRINKRVIIFHCLSLYPSPEEKINMKCMDKLKESWSPLPIGYSGHEIDLLPTFVAVSKGAHIIERHLTLSKKMKGSDHAASLEPQEFKELITNIRRIETILGKAERVMYPELTPLRDKLAKSVATKRLIQKGEVITKNMLTIKGPGTGIPPVKLGELVGRIATKDLAEDTIVPKEALKWQRKSGF
jgi:sialic acid synthase